MKSITLSVPDKDYAFFMKLVKSLDFVQVKDKAQKPPTKEEFLNGLREAVEEVKQIKAGKKKASSLKEFLDEL